MSKNALLGDGSPSNVNDSNILSGIPVETAVRDIVKAIYLKRLQVTVGGWTFVWLPKLLFCSEGLSSLLGPLVKKR